MVFDYSIIKWGSLGKQQTILIAVSRRIGRILEKNILNIEELEIECQNIILLGQICIRQKESCILSSQNIEKSICDL